MGILSNLHAQDASYNAAKKNIGAGLSLLKTAGSSLENQQKILTQMKELATTAASDLLSVAQRDALKSQFGELQKQLDNTVKSASLFGQNLTSSTAANVTIQSGINAGDTFTITAAKSDAVTLGADAASIDLDDSAAAQAAMTAIDDAISTVAESQSTLGTQETGLTKMLEVAESTQTNLKSSISVMEDADIPELTAQLAQLQTKQQMALQMLTISNQVPQYLLSLLR